MILKKLLLQNYRNYTNEEFLFKKGINIIIGDNAQGKTNLLESIYYVSNLKSHRLFSEEYLIKKRCKEAKLISIFESPSTKYQIQIKIDKTTKHIKVDNNKIKTTEYKKLINTVIFYPEELEIIKGYPEIRRDYLNQQLININDAYKKNILEYNKLLKMRNDWLKRKKHGENPDYEYFKILNNYFFAKAINLYLYRNKFINKLNETIELNYYKIANEKGLKLSYITDIFELYDDNKMLDEFKQKTENNFENEIFLGKTILGPHKDDIEFLLNNENLKIIGSQGQQRMAILAYKISELYIYKRTKKEDSILLLDDVFSELDDKKQQNILKLIKNYSQIIITTTDIKNIKIDKKNINIIQIKDGQKSKRKGEKHGK